MTRVPGARRALSDGRYSVVHPVTGGQTLNEAVEGVGSLAELVGGVDRNVAGSGSQKSSRPSVASRSDTSTRLMLTASACSRTPTTIWTRAVLMAPTSRPARIVAAKKAGRSATSCATPGDYREREDEADEKPKPDHPDPQIEQDATGQTGSQLR